MNAAVLVTIALSLYSCRVDAFRCYDCQGGPLTNCANVTMLGTYNECSAWNAQCYEAYIDYQNNALPMVQRRCWQPPDGSGQTDFCKAFDNPNGVLRNCYSCKSDLCNTNKNFWLD